MKRKCKFAAIALMVMMPAIVQSVLYRNAALDDAFITYRYSDNLVRGYGLVWNPGRDPVEGYTNFSWALLNALAIRIGLHPLLFSKLLGFVSTLGIVLLPLTRANKLQRHLSSKVLVALLISCCPVIIVYGQSGMEQNLFTFLLFLASLLYLRGIQGNATSSCICVSSAILGLAALTRPEGLGAFGIMLLYEIYRRVRQSGGKNLTTDIAKMALPFLAIWLPYYIWRFGYYGYPFPNSFYTKHTGGGFRQIVTGILYLSEGLRLYLAIPLALSVPILLGAAKRLGSLGQSQDDAFAALRDGVPYILFFIFCYLSYVVLVGGDDISAFPSVRLLVPVIPMAYMLVTVCLEIFGAAPDRLLTCASVALLLLVLASSFADVREFAKTSGPALRSHHSISEVLAGLVSFRPETYAEPDLAKWIRTQTTATSTIAVPWAGAISYYSKVRVIDMLGLNDEHIAHLPKRQRGMDVKMDPHYVLAQKPELVFINVHKKVALGELSFEEGGGWKLGDKELIQLLLDSNEYSLVIDAPTHVIVFRREQG